MMLEPANVRGTRSDAKHIRMVEEWVRSAWVVGGELVVTALEPRPAETGSPDIEAAIGPCPRPACPPVSSARTLATVPAADIARMPETLPSHDDRP